MNERDWVCISQAHDPYSIHIQKVKLDVEQIPASIFDQRDSSYNAFGMVYLWVPRQFEEEARKILNLDHEEFDH